MTRSKLILAVSIAALFSFTAACSKKDDDKKKPKPTKKDKPKKDKPKKDKPKKDKPKTAKMPKPKIGMLVVHKVKKFDKWLKAFHGHYKARKDAGVMGHFVARVIDKKGKPRNTVMVHLAGMDEDKLKTFAESKDLKKAMKKAGVVGKPQITWLKPLDLGKDGRIDMKDKKAVSYGVLVSFKVKDLEKWKEGFKKHAAMRQKLGVTGSEAGQKADQEDMVYVYHEHPDYKAIKKAFKDKKVRKAMKKAGMMKVNFMYTQSVHRAMYMKMPKH